MKWIARIIGAVAMLICVSGICYLLWTEEYRFLLKLDQGKVIEHLSLEYLRAWGIDTTDRPVYFHFYDPDCRYSNINISHLESVFDQYFGIADVYIVIRGELDTTEFREKHQLSKEINFLIDQQGSLTEQMGVSSIPRALLFDQQHHLYFEGNYTYGLSFCGASNIKQSAPINALSFLCKGNPPPLYLKVDGFSCSL